jgi:hypothetical protein
MHTMFEGMSDSAVIALFRAERGNMAPEPLRAHLELMYRAFCLGSEECFLEVHHHFRREFYRWVLLHKHFEFFRAHSEIEREKVVHAVVTDGYIRLWAFFKLEARKASFHRDFRYFSRFLAYMRMTFRNVIYEDLRRLWGRRPGSAVQTEGGLPAAYLPTVRLEEELLAKLSRDYSESRAIWALFCKAVHEALTDEEYLLYQFMAEGEGDWAYLTALFGGEKRVNAMWRDICKKIKKQVVPKVFGDAHSLGDFYIG